MEATSQGGVNKDLSAWQLASQSPPAEALVEGSEMKDIQAVDNGFVSAQSINSQSSSEKAGLDLLKTAPLAVTQSDRQASESVMSLKDLQVRARAQSRSSSVSHPELHSAGSEHERTRPEATSTNEKGTPPTQDLSSGEMAEQISGQSQEIAGPKRVRERSLTETPVRVPSACQPAEDTAACASPTHSPLLFTTPGQQNKDVQPSAICSQSLFTTPEEMNKEIQPSPPHSPSLFVTPRAPPKPVLEAKTPKRSSSDWKQAKTSMKKQKTGKEDDSSAEKDSGHKVTEIISLISSDEDSPGPIKKRQCMENEQPQLSAQDQTSAGPSENNPPTKKGQASSSGSKKKKKKKKKKLRPESLSLNIHEEKWQDLIPQSPGMRDPFTQETNLYELPPSYSLSMRKDKKQRISYRLSWEKDTALNENHSFGLSTTSQGLQERDPTLPTQGLDSTEELRLQEGARSTSADDAWKARQAFRMQLLERNSNKNAVESTTQTEGSKALEAVKARPKLLPSPVFYSRPKNTPEDSDSADGSPPPIPRKSILRQILNASREAGNPPPIPEKSVLRQASNASRDAGGPPPIPEKSILRQASNASRGAGHPPPIPEKSVLRQGLNASRETGGPPPIPKKSILRQASNASRDPTRLPGYVSDQASFATSQNSKSYWQNIYQGLLENEPRFIGSDYQIYLESRIRGFDQIPETRAEVKETLVPESVHPTSPELPLVPYNSPVESAPLMRGEEAGADTATLQKPEGPGITGDEPTEKGTKWVLPHTSSKPWPNGDGSKALPQQVSQDVPKQTLKPKLKAQTPIMQARTSRDRAGVAARDVYEDCHHGDDQDEDTKQNGRTEHLENLQHVNEGFVGKWQKVNDKPADAGETLSSAQNNHTTAPETPLPHSASASTTPDRNPEIADQPIEGFVEILTATRRYLRQAALPLCLEYGRYLENHDNQNISGIDHSALGYLVKWLNGVVTGECGQDLLRLSNNTPIYQYQLAHLWVLAGKFVLPQLQDDAIDMLAKRIRFDGKIQTEYFDFVFENASGGEPLRRYIIDVCASSVFSDELYSYFPEALKQKIERAQGLPEVHRVEDMEDYHVVIPGGSDDGEEAEVEEQGKGRA